MKVLNSLMMRLLLTGYAALSLTACSANLSVVDADGRTSKPNFPKLTDATRPEGRYVDLDNLHKVSAGMSKAQLYELIGTPHFSEGMFNVREWDYIFKLPQPSTTEPLVCQYKVLFDDQKVARSFLFSPQSCSQLLAPVAPLPSPEKQEISKLSLLSDTSFAFGRSTLQAEAINNLERFVSQLEGITLEQIEVIGHTDRIGASQDNLLLSQQRANAVRDFLITQGVARKLIKTQGFGAEYPIVTCEAKGPQPALVECLAPNRRVDIRIAGH